MRAILLAATAAAACGQADRRAMPIGRDAAAPADAAPDAAAPDLGWRTLVTSRQKLPTRDCTTSGAFEAIERDDTPRPEPAPLDADASAYQRAADVRVRTQRLVERGQLDEALALVEPAARTLVDEASKLPYCHLWLAVARLHEAGRRFGAARTAYQQATTGSTLYGCHQTAQARLAALKGVADGKPLKTFRVTGSVLAPPGVRVTVRLIADLADTRNPITPSREPGWALDPASPDHWADLVVLVPDREAGGGFELDAVPPGHWNLAVLAEGPVPYEPDGCWPHAAVVDRAVSLGTQRIVVDADAKVSGDGDPSRP